MALIFDKAHRLAIEMLLTTVMTEPHRVSLGTTGDWEKHSVVDSSWLLLLFLLLKPSIVAAAFGLYSTPAFTNIDDLRASGGGSLRPKLMQYSPLSHKYNLIYYMLHFVSERWCEMCMA